jgi:hypothetical protein
MLTINKLLAVSGPPSIEDLPVKELVKFYCKTTKGTFNIDKVKPKNLLYKHNYGSTAEANKATQAGKRK